MFADIYDGEKYDARIAEEWKLPDYDDGGWENVQKSEEFKGKIVSEYDNSVIVCKDLERHVVWVRIHDGIIGADSLSYGKVNVVRTAQNGRFRLEKGETAVVDFGQNFAGWECFCVEGARGTTVTVKHAEMLNDCNGRRSRGNDGAEGTAYLEALRSAKATTQYVLRGGGAEQYHPSHTYYGFRYLQITADAPVLFHSVTGQVVTSVTADTGYLRTSDSRINRLFENIRWGQYSNYLSVPTDCPQRDERLGWTADTQVFAAAVHTVTLLVKLPAKFQRAAASLRALGSAQRMRCKALPVWQVVRKNKNVCVFCDIGIRFFVYFSLVRLLFRRCGQ